MIENEQFTGDIPSELGQVESLSILSLGKYDNLTFTGDPIVLFSFFWMWLWLDIMINMHIANNVLVGTIPTELGALSKLSTFDVGKGHI